MCNSETFRIKQITDINDILISEIAKTEKENFSEPMSEKTIKDSIPSPYFKLYCATDENEKLLSYVALGQIIPEMQINSIASVIKRSGYGKRLLSEVLKMAKAEGIEEVTLEVRVSNTPAKELYSTLGFKIIAERKNLYDKPREDGFVMTLELK